jgi:3-dehydroquinate synthase
MDIKEVTVNCSKPYKVIITENPPEKTAIPPEFVRGSIAVITDDKVNKLYGDKFRGFLSEYTEKIATFVFPNGEQSKNFSTLKDILEFLAENRLTRTDTIAALGGGVTGDMAGFAAGIYLRGIRFINFPTTFLAAIDSSVGGKTAVDLNAGKNLAGVFLQPATVLCDCSTFKTLTDEEFSNGTAEAIKYGMISDAALFRILKKYDRSSPQIPVSETVERCVKIKAGIIEKDEFENGERQLLNFGHTLGHAVELLSNFSVPHGQAVAAGMAMITKYAAATGKTDVSVLNELKETLQSHNLPVSPHELGKFTPEELFKAALSDKKRRGNKITLVLPRKIGECYLETTDADNLLEVIKKGF